MTRRLKRDWRSGFTLTEVLVSIAILGLLMAVSMPAIQQVRESARKATCQNNLKQIGIGMANIVQTSGKFPTARSPDPAMWRLLPFLDQTPLYEELQSRGRSDRYAVSQFVCPDDSQNPVSNLGNSNYYLNDGTSFRLYEPTNGFRKDARHDTSPAEITDGLSNTAAMSERLVGVPTFLPPPEAEMRSEPKRYLWWTQTRYSDKGQESLAVVECRTHQTTPEPAFRGSYMCLYQEDALGYDHLLRPNERGCYNGPEDLDVESGVFLIPPSSDHPGGVNVLFADGSVHFIHDQIADPVWRALGTRNGNETVGEF